MAKYSVNGTQIIDDNGKIDWSLIKNNPLPTQITGFAAAYTNCSYGGYVVASTTISGTAVALNVTVAGGGANFNCQCQCQCQCNCDCNCRGA